MVLNSVFLVDEPIQNHEHTWTSWTKALASPIDPVNFARWRISGRRSRLWRHKPGIVLYRTDAVQSFVAPSSVIDAGHALHEMCGDMAVAWMKSRGELDEVALGSLGSGFVWCPNYRTFLAKSDFTKRAINTLGSRTDSVCCVYICKRPQFVSVGSLWVLARVPTQHISEERNLQRGNDAVSQCYVFAILCHRLPICSFSPNFQPPRLFRLFVFWR